MRISKTGWVYWIAHVALLGAAGAFAQSPVPLSGRADAPIEAPEISESDVELFGRMAAVWALEDGTQVIQYTGDFTLQVGRRRLSSAEAVIWMSTGEQDARTFQTIDVFLFRNARVRESAGTVTTGDELFATLHSFGKVTLNADRKVFEPTADTRLYQRADHWRHQVRSGRPTGDADEERADRVVTSLTQPQRPVIIVPGERLISEVRDGERITIAIGGIYMSQGAADSAEFLELRAENAVLYAPEAALEQGLTELEPGSAPRTQPAGEIPLEEADVEIAPPITETEIATATTGEWLSGAYLEGDVIISRGERVIRSPRVYYDFETNRALILDATMSAFEPSRGVPIIVRADEVRQLSSTEYSAQRAKVTTSEFHTPHYHIGAEEIYLQDRTPGRADPEVTGLIAGTYRMTHTTLNVEGVPIAYWPYSRGDFKQSEGILRSAAMGYSDDFGGVLRTKWYLANLLGTEEPPGFDSTLRLDYLTDRGPGIGIDIDYLQENYYGLVRSYYINDHGEDELGGYRDDVAPPNDNRGRFLWRHRQYLPKDWELSLELSYLSDANYLEEYDENDFDAGKEQETVLYLKKQRDNWAFTTQANWRLNDFQTQTEHLPEVQFYLTGEPIGQYVNSYTEARAGVVRYRLDDREVFDYRRLDNLANTDSVGRVDLREELTAPVPVGPVRVVPFVSARGTGWTDTPEKGYFNPQGGGSEGRFFGTAGARANMYISKIYEGIRSDLFDIRDIRHIIKPEFIGWYAYDNVDSVDLTPFDEGIETIDDFSGVVVAVRQRLQTKRGGPGNWRVVDWITLDLEAGFFSDSPDTFPRGTTRGRTIWYRPENSVAQNYLYGNAMWRISDSTAILTDFNWNFDRGKFDTANVSLAVQRTPRFSYFIGWRYVREIESSLLGFGANYEIDKKHTVAFRNYFDLERGENAEFAITYIRKWPRWYTGISFELDDTQDTVGISLSIWPEGAPEFAVGPRRYTQVSSSTAITQ